MVELEMCAEFQCISAFQQAKEVTLHSDPLCYDMSGLSLVRKLPGFVAHQAPIGLYSIDYDGGEFH